MLSDSCIILRRDTAGGGGCLRVYIQINEHGLGRTGSQCVGDLAADTPSAGLVTEECGVDAVAGVSQMVAGFGVRHNRQAFLQPRTFRSFRRIPLLRL